MNYSRRLMQSTTKMNERIIDNMDTKDNIDNK